MFSFILKFLYFKKCNNLHNTSSFNNKNKFIVFQSFIFLLVSPLKLRPIEGWPSSRVAKPFCHHNTFPATAYKIVLLSTIFLSFFIQDPPPPGLLPVLGPLERYLTPTLDAALLCSSMAGADLGQRKGPGVLHWELRHSLSTTE